MALIKKDSNELIDFNVEEVSTVDKGANHKKFYLTKQDGNMDLAAVLKEFKFANETDTDKNLEVFKAAAAKKGKKLTDGTMKTMKAILGLMETVKSELPDGASIAIRNDDFSASAHIQKDEGEVKTELEKAQADVVKAKEDLAGLEKTNKELTATIKKGETMSLSAEDQLKITKADEVEKINKELKETNEKLVKRVDGLEDVNDDNKFLKMATDEYPLVDKPENTAKLLKEASKTMSKEGFEAMQKSFKKTNEALESSDIFKETGSNLGDDGADNTAKIQKMAEEMAKADPKMSIEKARIEVRKNNPELR